jgi:hypothetical protein
MATGREIASFHQKIYTSEAFLSLLPKSFPEQMQRELSLH